MRKTGIAVASLLALLALAQGPGAGAYHSRGEAQGLVEEWENVVLTLRQVSGSGVRGVGLLSAHRRGPTRVRALVVGLGGRSLTDVHLVLSARRCRELGATESVGRGLTVDVAEDGSAFAAAENAFTPRAVRRAGALVVLADPDADGTGDVLACGNASHVTATRDPERASGTLATAERRPSLLALALSRTGRRVRTSVAVTGLEPDTAHTLVVSRRSCRQLRSESGRLPVTRVARFETDAAGQAMFANYDERWPATVAVMTRPFSDGLVLCTRTTVDGVAGD